MNTATSPGAEESGPENAPERKSALVGWCERLNDSRSAGVRARLRRARSRAEAAVEPTALSLLRMFSEREIEGALDLARVLAHVRTHEGRQRVMQRAGWKRFPEGKESDAADERPLLSEVRFRRLLQTEPGNAWVTAIVRLVRQLDGVVNVDDLARDFLAWYDPDRREDVKIKWAKEYYAVRQAGVIAIVNAQ